MLISWVIGQKIIKVGKILKNIIVIYKLRNLNFSLDNDKFDKTLETTRFENLKNLENKQGFKEGVIDKQTGKKVNFFDEGSKRDWSKSLDPIIASTIEGSFKEEMIELGYL
jgi:hypothetical protein